MKCIGKQETNEPEPILNYVSRPVVALGCVVVVLEEQEEVKRGNLPAGTSAAGKLSKRVSNATLGNYGRFSACMQLSRLLQLLDFASSLSFHHRYLCPS